MAFFQIFLLRDIIVLKTGSMKNLYWFQIALLLLVSNALLAEEPSASDLRYMLEKPEQFHREIQDVNQGHPKIMAMTGEMINFYAAVALVEAKNCFLAEDPRACELFIESMKDPAGHVGFMSFMVAAGKTNEWLMFLSKGKLPSYLSRNVGLMVGMMVQETLVEFLKHPSTKELAQLPWNKQYPDMKSKYQRAKHLKNELWKDTYGNKDWRIEKGITGLSLLSAVALTSGSQFLIKQGAKHTVAKVGLSLGKRIWVGSSFIRVATPVGLSITGAILFLEWSGFTEKYVAQPLREKYAQEKLNYAIERLNMTLFRKRTDIDELAKNVADQYHNFRTVILRNALAVYYGHQATLAKISQDFYSLTRYYTWIVEGFDQSTYDENEGNWHDENWIKDLAHTRSSLFENIFCGPSVAQSLKLKLDFKGLPLPSYSATSRDVIEDLRFGPNDRYQMRDIKITPYKLIHYPNTCFGSIHALNTQRYPKGKISNGSEVYCPVKKINGVWNNGKFLYTNYLGCKIMIEQYRNDLLYSGYLADQLEYSNLSKLSTLLMRVEKLKKVLILRYEKSVQKSILIGLNGTNKKIAKVSGRPIIKGSIPLLKNEIDYWQNLINKTNNSEVKRTLHNFLEQAKLQLEYALKLNIHMSKPRTQRTYDEDLNLLFNLDEWSSMAKFYHQLILIP